jgi:hypothetical protein
MRWHRIVTQTLLIFFIVHHQVVNFVFGAPVAAREKLEGCIDVDGTEDETAALQKRVNPVEEGSTNMAGQMPLSADRTEVDQLWQEMGEQSMLVEIPCLLHHHRLLSPPPRTPPPKVTRVIP